MARHPIATRATRTIGPHDRDLHGRTALPCAPRRPFVNRPLTCADAQKPQVSAVTSDAPVHRKFHRLRRVARDTPSADALDATAGATGRGTTTVPVAVVATQRLVEDLGRAGPSAVGAPRADDVHREVRGSRDRVPTRDQLGGDLEARRRRGPARGTARRSTTRTAPRRRR